MISDTNAAARFGGPVEIDGDPSRQDIDFALARQAIKSGCLFAVDSDAHSVSQFSFTETAIAHARLGRHPARACRQLLGLGPVARMGRAGVVAVTGLAL